MIEDVFYSEQLEDLIAQRYPFVMVDSIRVIEGTKVCLTTLVINPSNIFLDEDNYFTQEGILEHIAQSSAALLGCHNQNVSIGYIGEVCECQLSHLKPRVNDVIMTRISYITKVGNIHLVSAQSSTKTSQLVSCKMKLFMK